MKFDFYKCEGCEQEYATKEDVPFEGCPYCGDAGTSFLVTREVYFSSFGDSAYTTLFSGKDDATKSKYAGAELAQADECDNCNGTGCVETGIEHTGIKEAYTCKECDGTGYIECVAPSID